MTHGTSAPPLPPAPPTGSAARLRREHDALYYGCWGGAGHDIFTVRGRTSLGAGWNNSPSVGSIFPGGYRAAVAAAMSVVPTMVSETHAVSFSLREREPEGVAGMGTIDDVDGETWTLIGFADRTVDPRGACVSVFFLRGRMEFAPAVCRARERFPSIFARFPFAVVHVFDYCYRACSFCGRRAPVGAFPVMRAIRGHARMCGECMERARRTLDGDGPFGRFVTWHEWAEALRDPPVPHLDSAVRRHATVTPREG